VTAPAPEKDPLAIGLGALGAGAGLGGTCILLLLLVVRTLQRAELRRYGSAISDTSLEPLAGLFAAVVIAVFFGWRRSHALDNIWQRGVICALAAFGAIILAFLAIPFWHFLGFAGLGLLMLASLALGIAASAWSVHGSGE
jgi:TctA family transporter